MTCHLKRLFKKKQKNQAKFLRISFERAGKWPKAYRNKHRKRKRQLQME